MNKIYTDDEKRSWQKQLTKKNVSAHVIVRLKDKILLVKPIYKNNWVLPGGIVDEGEAPKYAAIRELHEETGIKIDTDKLIFAGVSHIPSHRDFPDRIAFNFIFDFTEEPSLLLQPDEIEFAEWVPVETMLDKTGHKRTFYVDIKQKLQENEFPFYSDLLIIP